MIEVPPSTEYLVLDTQGAVLAKDGCPALATRRARTEIEGAVAVVGSPSGVLLAHIVHGPTDTRPALRAQAVWKKTEGALLAANAEERTLRAQAKRDRKNARRREKRLFLREQRLRQAEDGVAAATPGSIPPEPARESGVRVVGEEGRPRQESAPALDPLVAERTEASA